MLLFILKPSFIIYQHVSQKRHRKTLKYEQKMIVFIKMKS